MLTLFKILTLPVWLPLKLLWIASKIIAVIVLIIIAAILVYIAIHVL